MAADPNAVRAAQAGKTVTTADGYQISYDDNGFGRKTVAPDGSVKFYDSLGNQTKTEWTGPTPSAVPSGPTPSPSQSTNPEVQLKTIDQNLAIAKANGDTQKIDALTTSKENAQALVDVNNGKYPSTNTTSGAVPTPDGGFTSTDSAGTVSKFNSKGELVSMTDTPTVTLPSGEKAVYVEVTGTNKTGTSETSGPAQTGAATVPDSDAGSYAPGGSRFVTPVTVGQPEKVSVQESLGPKEEIVPNKDYTNQPKSNMGSVDQLRSSAQMSAVRDAIKKDDWRLRISLAPGSNYLYGAATPGQILHPLKQTDGVIFPYSPSIQTAYRASYDSSELTHSNYKLHFYKHSNVDEIQITADFTAQDTAEANYLLAAIHFFKSATKMFYGQDGNNGPKAGTPPPLCYLNGFGKYQFNEHPVLISSFTYNLPNDVDYVRAGKPNLGAAKSSSFKSQEPPPTGFNLMKFLRQTANNLKNKRGSGKSPSEVAWKNYSSENATYVPTKMQIQLTLIPVVTRNDISKNFSLEKYATGELLNGKSRPNGGGMW